MKYILAIVFIVLGCFSADAMDKGKGIFIQDVSEQEMPVSHGHEEPKIVGVRVFSGQNEQVINMPAQPEAGMSIPTGVKEINIGEGKKSSDPNPSKLIESITVKYPEKKQYVNWVETYLTDMKVADPEEYCKMIKNVRRRSRSGSRRSSLSLLEPLKEDLKTSRDLNELKKGVLNQGYSDVDEQKTIQIEQFITLAAEHAVAKIMVERDKKEAEIQKKQGEIEDLLKSCQQTKKKLDCSKWVNFCSIGLACAGGVATCIAGILAIVVPITTQCKQ